jgi:hypothetical protein
MVGSLVGAKVNKIVSTQKAMGNWAVLNQLKIQYIFLLD